MSPMACHTILTETVLLEAPFNPSQHRPRNSVLLAIDLTKAVADEAINRRDSVVVAYRMPFPPITHYHISIH